MSVELINDCVVIPHQPNWRDTVTLDRAWDTKVAKGVTGAEDRATGRTDAPRALGYSVLTLSLQDRARFAARCLAALKKGRACVPLWPRAQYMGAQLGAALPKGFAFEFIGVSGLVVGRLYYYQRGPYDVRIFQTDGPELFGSGYFVATATTARIAQTPALLPNAAGNVYPVNYAQIATEGLWPWAAGDYAFLHRSPPLDGEFTHENKAAMIDCGGEGSGAWTEDAHFTGGADYATETAVDATAVIGFTAPPSTVMQSARVSAAFTPQEAEISYELPGFAPGIECRIRLHFAELDESFDGAGRRRVFDVAINGLSEWREARFDLFAAAGNDTHKAVIRDALLLPDAQGKLRVTLRPTAARVVRARSGDDVYLGAIIPFAGGVDLASGDLLLLNSQTDPSENGVWRVNNATGPIHQRVEVFAGEIFQIAEGTYESELWVNTNTVIAPGDVLTFSKPASEPFAACLSAIEVYQYTWEVVQLQSGSGANLLKLPAWLKGHYAAGSAVYPAFFGKPSVQNAAALTDYHAEIRLKVAEPLPVGPSATSCPPLVCDLPPCFADIFYGGKPGGDEWDYPPMPEGWANNLRWGPAGVGDETHTAYGLAHEGNGAGLPAWEAGPEEFLEWWAGETLRQFNASMEGTPVHHVRLFWAKPPEGDNSNRYDANIYWETEPQFSTYSVIGAGQWEIHVAYMLGPGDGGGGGNDGRYAPGLNYDCLL